jgi:AbrB family looped-hinge helix DNA binding protein
METTRLSSKGQIVLPKSIRDAHGWETGATFAIEETKDGNILLRSLNAPQATLSEVAGCLRPPRKERARTMADMDAAIASEVKRRHARGRY